MGYQILFSLITHNGGGGESKLAKAACIGSLTPHFVKDDYVTPERVCSTAHAYQELLAASGSAFVRNACRSFTVKALAVLRWSCTGVRGYVLAVMVVMAVATAAASARREAVFQLPCQPGESNLSAVPVAPVSSSRLLAHTLPTQGSTNSAGSVNSNTVGAVNRNTQKKSQAKINLCNKCLQCISHLARCWRWWWWR